jgi:hypothetical protein
MNLAESGVLVEATNDNRAGLLRFDLTGMHPDAHSFYVIVMSFDTHYNEVSAPTLLCRCNTTHCLCMPDSDRVDRWVR